MTDQAQSRVDGADLPDSLGPVVQALAGMPLPAFVLDAAGKLRYVNTVARRRTARAGRLETYADLFEGEAPAAEAVRLEAFEEGAVEKLCHDVVGGHTFRMTCTRVDATGGQGAFLVGVMHQGGDIIATSRSAQELREDAMQSAIDAHSDAILLFDADFRCVLSNGLAQEATGYPAAELAFLTLMDLGVAKSKDEISKLLAQADSGKPAGARGILQTGRGEKLPVRAQVGLLVGSSTRVVGLCSFPPPRVTSGRLAAVRQSGTFARPGAGRASGAFARPVSGKASGSLARPAAKPAEPAPPAAPAKPEPPAKPAKPAASKPASPKTTLTGPGPAPATPPPKLIAPGAPTASAAPDTTQPSAPPDGMEIQPLTGPDRATGFEKPESTLELELGDLEPASAVRPPPPPQKAPPKPAASPGRPKNVLVQITADPPQVANVGPEIEPLLGYSAEEVGSWSAEEWLKRVHQPALADQLKQMWTGLVGQRFEPGALPDQVMDYPLVRNGGGVVHCSTTWRAVQAEDGAFLGLEIIIHPK